ncbi:hypothetical protein I3760_06G048300 [Carya illinoinensis]|uniref:uncharacterized protein LOC122314344 isoform X1 n=1 Tax=Carya illinoinensis TaxID=32201 RepID=UPI001BF35663|nr:uncharacterized protein LOC122314344 isoform X1 [Carya illinoinensis]KAG2701503.1 hypothetical protein I3760_06G048300 [Carya illinoinensis]
MEGAEEELERRSKFLDSLIKKKKGIEQHDCLNVRVRASDMPLPLQNRAFRCARDQLESIPGKLDSKRLALELKKVTRQISVQKNLAGTRGDRPVNYSSRHTMDELQPVLNFMNPIWLVLNYSPSFS